jgi:hypothetical protein
VFRVLLFLAKEGIEFMKVWRMLSTVAVGRVAQYNDWLRVGRSGDRIQAWTIFSAPVQTGPGAHPASCTMGTGSFL